MDIDMEELSAEHQQMHERSLTEVERADAQRRFVKLAIKNFPTIVARLEAAQRLRERVEIVQNKLGDDELDDVIADFDKETE